MLRRVSLHAFCALVGFSIPLTAQAVPISWDGGAAPAGLDGSFQLAANWDPDQIPVAGDTVTIDNPTLDTFTITFASSAFSDSLTVTGLAPLNLRSQNATVRSYNLGSGAADLLVNSGLNVGGIGVPLVLFVGDDADIGTNNFGSVTVSGTGSQLTVNGAGSHDIGLSGNSGTLTYQNSASGTIAGTLDVGVSGTDTTTGLLEVESGADLDVANLNIGTNASSVATGAVTVTGSGSTLDMSGALIIGSAAGNVGTLNVNSSGIFNTATTGTAIVNATGDINIGGGTLNLNTNTTVNGGAITRTSGTLTLGSGKTFTAQSNAQINLGGSITLSGGTTWNVNSGADLFGSGAINIGNSGGTTNVTIDGSNSSLATGGTSDWGLSGSTANVTIQNNATTNLAGIDLADSSTAGTTGTITVETGADMTVGTLNIADNGGATTTGTVTVTGSGSTITQSGTSALTVGHSSTGTATINVNSSGVFNTAVGGAVTVNATGDINIGGGTLNLRGNTTVDGGSITRTSGNLNLDPGRTLTAQNGGTVDVGGGFLLSGGTTWNFNSGADLIGSDAINIGFSDGTTAVTVDGTGSSLTTGFASTWGFAGNTANVTIRNDATANLSNIFLAGSGTAGTAGTISVDTSAEMNVGNLNVATAGGTGIVTVTGSGSTITQSPGSTLTVGHASAGSATINVTSGGIFNTGTGAVTINATGEINIGGGTLNLNGDTTVNGGRLDVGFGSAFSLSAGKTLTMQNGGDALITGAYTATSNSSYNVTGIGSSFSAPLTVGNNAEVNVTGGAIFSTSAAGLNIGTSGNGTLDVDGAGSNVQAHPFATSSWGSGGSTATVTFSNLASGNVGTLSLANSVAGGTTANVDVLSGATLTATNLQMATLVGATSAILDVQGSGSSLNIGSGTIGAASGSTAAINIGTTGSGAVFTTGVGSLLTINATGTVTIGSNPNTGTLNANGDVMIDGGTLIRSFGSNFNLDPLQTMTIQNGGEALFTGNYTTPLSAIYNVSGAGSILETTSTGNTLTIAGGTTVNVTSQGTISAGGSLDITSGTLIVDGVGSSADAGSSGQWGLSGGTANVTLSNGATADFAPFGLLLANTATANTTANVSVLSGADLTSGSMSLATTGGAGNSATLTVDGAGSTFASGGLHLGHASNGTAVVNVQNGGAVTVGAGGTTTLNATGTINIGGGTVDLKTLSNNGGSINFNSGTLSYIGNLIVGEGGPLGDNVTLTSDHRLTLSGTVSVLGSSTLTLSGGVLSTGSLGGNGGFNFDGGTLNMTADGGSLGVAGVFSSDADTTININANNVSLGNSFFFGAFNHQGTLNVGTNTISLLSVSYSRLGVVTSLDGGTINANNGVLFAGGSNLLGHGTINGRVAAELGSVVSATNGALALGDATSPAGYVSNGELRTRNNSVTLNSSAQATLGNLTTLGEGASPGTLNATNGVIIDFGHSITGFGTINSTNTLAKRTIINGVAQGNSVAEPLTFTGYIKGVGTFDNVTFTGTFDPGLSPAALTVGNLAFSPSSTLAIEVGGLSPGSEHDQIISSGQLAFDGILQVSLFNSFSPLLGQSFNIFDWVSLSGSFDTINLPVLSESLAWDTSQLYVDGTLRIAAAALPGDFNHDSSVNAADYVTWRKGVDVDPTDDNYNLWRTNFGFTLGSGASTQEHQPAPEPSSFPLLITCLALLRTSRDATRRRLIR